MKNQETKPLVAYFSMEIAVCEELHNYAGGLGILAGDLLRSAADQGIEMIGVSLINRSGYFKQTIGKFGQQIAKPENNNLKYFKKLAVKEIVMIGLDQVVVGAWLYQIKGVSGRVVNIYFLDTNFPENKKVYRELCDDLYGGTHLHRLKQEIILGRGGIKILQALNIEAKKIHINEGHGALALLELFLQNNKQNLRALKERAIFTTHSPIKEATDVFSLVEMKRVQKDFPLEINELTENNEINMAKVAMYFSGFINGVSKKHGEISRKIFLNPKIKAITNGVHLGFWVSPVLKKIFQTYFPGWEKNNRLLSTKNISPAEIWSAHQEAKRDLLSRVLLETGEFLEMENFTIVVARRFAPYKRSGLLLEKMTKLLAIQKKFGPIQIIYAGKAHPKDKEGQAIIKHILDIKKKYQNRIKIVFLPDYKIELAKLLVSGADLWLNTPLPPNEASGTSGMKAAANGIPQFSTIDGWWPEGYHPRRTGWKIFSKQSLSDNQALLSVLESEILPIFYQDPKKWQKMMSETIRLNAYQFSSERAIKDYLKMAYEK